MMSRTVAVALLAGGCLAAAAGGSYLAVRQNSAGADASRAAVAADAVPPALAVAETEAVVTPDTSKADAAGQPPAEPAAIERPEPPRPVETRPTRARTARRPADTRPVAAPPVEPPVSAPATPAPAATPAATTVPVETPPAEPIRPSGPEFDEIIVPASSVIGLEVDRTISSEQAAVEDRVEARVTRDVYADGRLAVPAGSRVIGHVTLVERGGKVRERARLGIRFHTIVLADGRQLPVRTDPVYREGDSPGAESSRKIGGAAIGGAVLGAILGGGKGAMTGAAVGAAGGTAAVMAGGRNPATLAAGSVVNVRLSSPVTIEIER